MAYFLKQSKLKKGIYLQIYDSFRDAQTKKPKHKSYKALGYVDDLIKSGIADPILYYQQEVDGMNQSRKDEKTKRETKVIADSPIRNLGYILPKGVLNRLNVASDIRYMNLMRNFGFDIYNLFEDLVVSRMVSPCSKLKTWEDIIPSLYGKHIYSLSQIYEAVEFIGSEYEKFIDVFNRHISTVYGRKTSKVYFDCTNYYFEIDAEYQDKMKGPSKENRTDPIIGMALMLDENQLPIGMKMYPGNESEKPKLRNMIAELKSRNHIVGKTIQVADKGLNCSENIVAAILNHDGYIFSKSVRQLPATELEQLLSEDTEYKEVLDKNGKQKFKYHEYIADFEYQVKTVKGTMKKVSLPEKRVLTWNPDLAEKQKHEIQKLMDKAVSLTKAKAKKNEYGEASKYVDFVSVNKKSGEVEDENTVAAVLNKEKFKKDLSLAGYNLLVTSEMNMEADEIYRVYHNLWRIEESFRILKSQLDARPVYLHKQNSIYGHFLICYTAVLLLRILQFNTFRNEIGYHEILDFIQHFQCVQEKESAVNLSSLSLVKNINDRLKLGFSHYYLSDDLIRKWIDSSF